MPPRSGHLLERELELASLASLAGDAAAGIARIALVEGAAGIGKTRLLAESRRHCSVLGMRVLAARGSELEREFPFGVVRQLFEPALAQRGALAGAAASARPLFEAVCTDEDDGDSSFAVLHGLFWLTVNLTNERPLALAVDDLHWCDRPSLRFLTYLSRRLDGLPVLLLGSLRPAEPGSDAVLLAELATDPLTVAVRPAALSEDAAAQLVAARLGGAADRAFLDACQSATLGNPLLLQELLKALAADGVRPDSAHVDRVRDIGPRAASRAVLPRLARLPEEARALARAVAVLGDGAQLPAVARLAGLDDDVAARAAAALTQAEILRDDPRPGFVHPLVRDAIYGDLPGAERELAHRCAAAQLADAGAAAEQVAAHLLQIAPRGEDWVVATLRAAATSALRKGAAESAVSVLRRALREPPVPGLRAQVLLELGLAESLMSGPDAAEHLRSAYDATADPVARARIADILARALLFGGAPAEAVDVAREAGGALPEEQSELRDRLEAFELTAVLFGVGDPRTLRRLERYRTVPAGAGVGAKMLAAIAAQAWVFSGGPASAGAELALQALAGGELLAADNGLTGVIAINALTYTDRDEALAAWDESLADAHERGSQFSISAISLWRGLTLHRRGELVEAEASMRDALGMFSRYGADVAMIFSSALLTCALVERGEVAAARAALELAADSHNSSEGARWWLYGRLSLLLAEGDAEQALTCSDELERRWGGMPDPGAVPWRLLRAGALDRLGRHDDAVALVRGEIERARAFGAPGALGRALRAGAEIGGADGLPLLEEAVAVLEHSPARFEHARALAALGGALRRADRAAAAREALRRALELAELCGAAALAEHVRSELQAAGARPRTTELCGPGALTASEQRVAGQAAVGRSNRDIAQALFVTPKTVELHLSNAYRKLGIRSRRDLAGALAAG